VPKEGGKIKKKNMDLRLFINDEAHPYAVTDGNQSQHGREKYQIYSIEKRFRHAHALGDLGDCPAINPDTGKEVSP